MRIVHLLMCMFTATLSLVAQEQTAAIHLGGFAGYGINTHLSNFQALPAIPCCSPGFTGGTGGGLNAGLLAGYRFTASSSIQLRVGYAGLHGSLLRDEQIGNTLVVRAEAPFDTTTADITTRHSIDATLHTLFLEPTLVWSPASRLGLHAGISGAVLLTADFQQKEQLQSPSTVVFAGSDSRVRNNASGVLPGAASVLLHVVAGVSYDFPIAAHTVLAPDVRFRLPLNSITDVDWQVGVLALGVALKVDLAGPEPVRIKRDTVLLRDTVQRIVAGIDKELIYLADTEESITESRGESVVVQTLVKREHYSRDIPVAQPLARLVFTGIAADGRRTDAPVIAIEEVQTQESFPLLPYVFFRRGEADMDNTFQHQLQQAETLDTTALQFSALAVYADMLNILAARMHSFPDSKIVITGCRGDDEDDNTVSQRRARAVWQYLTTTGGVEPERIVLQSRGLPAAPSNISTAEGREENRRAEIATDDPRLLAPMVLRTVERVVTPPELECAPEILSAEIANWRLTVKGVESGYVVFDTVATGIPQPIRLQPAAAMLMNDTALAGEFTVMAGNGAATTIEQRLPLRRLTLARKSNDSTNIEIERFALVLFGYNSTGISEANEQILQQVRARIFPQSRVRIVGYSDRTGEGEYNQKLAERRGREVLRLLGLANAELEAVGSSHILFDNDLPHGRMYSRTVHIIIETPVKQPSN